MFYLLEQYTLKVSLFYTKRTSQVSHPKLAFIGFFSYPATSIIMIHCIEQLGVPRDFPRFSTSYQLVTISLCNH